jgi:hypothetical protein
MVEVKSHVEKLAAAPCPGTCPCCSESCNDLPLRHCPNCQCQGTGALVWGLRMECDGAALARDPTSLPEYCCLVCGWLTGKFIHADDCEPCQGRGWVLKPQAEQRVAMEDWALDKGYFIEHRPAFVCVAGITVRVHTDESREEALAHAICQAYGIE